MAAHLVRKCHILCATKLGFASSKTLLLLHYSICAILKTNIYGSGSYHKIYSFSSVAPFSLYIIYRTVIQKSTWIYIDISHIAESSERIFSSFLHFFWNTSRKSWISWLHFHFRTQNLLLIVSPTTDLTFLTYEKNIKTVLSWVILKARFDFINIVLIPNGFIF